MFQSQLQIWEKVMKTSNKIFNFWSADKIETRPPKAFSHQN